MKSLKESLFDRDLVTKDTLYTKLLQICKKKPVMHVIDIMAQAYREGYFEYIPNKYLKEWCEEMYNKNYQSNPFNMGYIGFPGNRAEQESEKEAKGYLQFNKIHHKVYWNTCMYANTFDIPWSNWGHTGTVTEWIAVQYKYDVILVINSDGYDKIDQMLIHELILSLYKLYGKVKNESVESDVSINEGIFDDNVKKPPIIHDVEIDTKIWKKCVDLYNKMKKRRYIDPHHTGRIIGDKKIVELGDQMEEYYIDYCEKDAIICSNENSIYVLSPETIYMNYIVCLGKDDEFSLQNEKYINDFEVSFVYTKYFHDWCVMNDYETSSYSPETISDKARILIHNLISKL